MWASWDFVGYCYLGLYCALESCRHLGMVYSGLKSPALSGIWTPEIDFIRGDRLEGDLIQEMETLFFSKATPG